MTTASSPDPLKYKDIKEGDLVMSKSFQGGYATVLDKRIEWELTPISNEHIQWGLVKVIDGYGEVFWFELEEHEVYPCYHPTTGAPITQHEEKIK